MNNVETVETKETKLLRFDLIGNVIDHEWYHHVCYENGKTNFGAVLLLGSIAYWYRPRKDRKESTDEVINGVGEKKFKADFLQMSRKLIEKKFNMTTQQVRDALALLDKLGIITRHYRSVEIPSNDNDILTHPNVLYIELNIDKLKSISTCAKRTYGESKTTNFGPVGLQTTHPIEPKISEIREDIDPETEEDIWVDADDSDGQKKGVVRKIGGLGPRAHSYTNISNRIKSTPPPQKNAPLRGAAPRSGAGGGGIPPTPGGGVFLEGSDQKSKIINSRTFPKKEIPAENAFNAFWALYPRKLNQAKAQKQFMENIHHRNDVQAMMNSVMLYSAYCQRNNVLPKFIQMPATFLKDAWNDAGSLAEWSANPPAAKEAATPAAKRLPLAQMPSDAKQRLKKLVDEKKLMDAFENTLTANSGFVREFLDTGYWASLPLFIQKAIVAYQMPEKPKPKPSIDPNEEPNGWQEYVLRAYMDTPRIRGYIEDGWRTIAPSIRTDLIREMEQEKMKQSKTAEESNAEKQS
jgi:hypothetical protein